MAGNSNNRVISLPGNYPKSTSYTYTPPPARTKVWDFSATSMKAEKSPIRKVGDAAPLSFTPEVYYTTAVWQSIRYLVAKCTQEVGWLGTVEATETGDYLVTEIFVPPQKVSGAETEIDKSAMEELYDTLIDAGKDPSKLIYWGHSHVNMGVSPSPQDERQIEEYLDTCPVFIRGIYNKAGASKVDVFDRDEGVVYQCVDAYALHDVIPRELRTTLDTVIDTNVKNWGFHRQNTWSGTPAPTPAPLPSIYAPTAQEKAATQSGPNFMSAAELEEYQFYAEYGYDADVHAVLGTGVQ